VPSADAVLWAGPVSGTLGFIAMRTLLSLFQEFEIDEDLDLCVEVQRFAEITGWQAVMKSSFDILARQDLEPHWGAAIDAVYFGKDHVNALPWSIQKCVARLYYCIAESPTLDNPEKDNQVWSTVHDWIGESYTSNWNPYDDPAIAKHISSMKNEA
jgi:hypothetical protein